MQFIERSALGLRAAVYTLAHSEHRTRFMLFPMVDSEWAVVMEL